MQASWPLQDRQTTKFQIKVCRVLTCDNSPQETLTYANEHMIPDRTCSRASSAAVGTMHRLHVLIVVLSCVIALRGFQVLQLFGIMPRTRVLRSRPGQCSDVQLAPPYLASLQYAAAAEDDTMRSLESWLSSNDASMQNVQISRFSGLRGLQVAVTAVPTPQMQDACNCQHVNSSTSPCPSCSATPAQQTGVASRPTPESSALQATVDVSKDNIVLAIPTHLCISIGTFSGT